MGIFWTKTSEMPPRVLSRPFNAKTWPFWPESPNLPKDWMKGQSVLPLASGRVSSASEVERVAPVCHFMSTPDRPLPRALLIRTSMHLCAPPSTRISDARVAPARFRLPAQQPVLQFQFTTTLNPWTGHSLASAFYTHVLNW